MDVYLDFCLKPINTNKKTMYRDIKLYGLLFGVLTCLTVCLSQVYWLLPSLFLASEIYLKLQKTIEQPKPTGIRFINCENTRIYLYLYMVVFFLSLYGFLYFGAGDMFIKI